MSADREERLAAWLDGTLPEQEAAAFEAELAADPELARQAETWRSNDARIAAAFAPIAERPVDDALIAAMGLCEPPPPSAANDNSPWWRRHALPLGGAIAASLLAAVLLNQFTAKPARESFDIALDTTPSLGEAKLADGRVLRPTLTVRAADGRYCREYSLADTVGLACRQGGQWKIEAQARGAGPNNGGEIRTAGSTQTAELDAAFKRIGASDPLDAGSEAALIAKGW